MILEYRYRLSKKERERQQQKQKDEMEEERDKQMEKEDIETLKQLGLNFDGTLTRQFVINHHVVQLNFLSPSSLVERDDDGKDGGGDNMRRKGNEESMSQESDEYISGREETSDNNLENSNVEDDQQPQKRQPQQKKGFSDGDDSFASPFEPTNKALVRKRRGKEKNNVKSGDDAGFDQGMLYDKEEVKERLRVIRKRDLERERKRKKREMRKKEEEKEGKQYERDDYSFPIEPCHFYLSLHGFLNVIIGLFSSSRDFSESAGFREGGEEKKLTKEERITKYEEELKRDKEAKMRLENETKGIEKKEGGGGGGQEERKERGNIEVSGGGILPSPLIFTYPLPISSVSLIMCRFLFRMFEVY
jgi:hypothetical protein